MAQVNNEQVMYCLKTTTFKCIVLFCNGWHSFVLGHSHNILIQIPVSCVRMYVK